MNVKLNRFQIAQKVFSAEGRKGHLKWRVNDVAKAAKISRSLVYYHFGKTKKEILLNSLTSIAEEFYGLTEDHFLYSKSSLIDALLRTHRMYKENTIYAVFYQKWRHIPSAIQDKYIEIEAQYEQKLLQNFPRASSLQLKALHAIFHGLVTAPYLDEHAIREAVQLLKLDELKSS